MQKLPLPWNCLPLLLLTLGMPYSTIAANFTVVPARVGITFYWNPTNLVVQAGDTVTWSNLQNIHSVNPAPSSTDPFCGTGTNVISSCTVTFQNPGLYLYDCYQHLPSMTGSVRVVAAPSVAITNPPNNTLYSTQSVIVLEARASVAGGTITNLQFLRNNVAFATNTTSPYRVTVSNLPPGNQIFRARVLDNAGTLVTSSPLTLRIATLPRLTVTNTPTGPLQFSYPSSLGVNYVVEGGETVSSFSPILTNGGTGNPQQFSQTNPAPPQKFFRLRLQ